jgi:heme/copper-type cytochrome/quinol oxidase subunit 2
MHTLRLTVIGLVLLSVFVFVAAQINQRKGKAVDGAKPFIWVWLAVAAMNFYVGVFIAGYSVLTELLVHSIVFGVPAGTACYLSRRFRRSAATTLK